MDVNLGSGAKWMEDLFLFYRSLLNVRSDGFGADNERTRSTTINLDSIAICFR